MKTKPSVLMGDLFMVALFVSSLALFFATMPLWLPVVWIRRSIKYRGAPATCCRSGCRPCPWGNPKMKHRRAAVLAEIASEQAQGETRFRCYKPDCRIRRPNIIDVIGQEVDFTVHR